jgi:hypothetical protein
MRSWLRCVSYSAVAVLLLSAGPALPAHKNECRKGAMEKLRDQAPDGYAVFQQIHDKKFFLNWLSCDEGQFGLPTAVHESVHFITGDADAFPLVDGGEIKRPHEVSDFYAPSRIAKSFKTDDYVSTYLKPGRASSSSDFLYLLDELNAYTHDLEASVDLQSLRREDRFTDNRDGLAALMAFVALYVDRARESEPETWNGLQQPDVAKTVGSLWDRAEKVMQSSCGIPNIGSEDKTYIRKFCQPAVQASLQAVIGRAPVCPSDCLNAVEPDVSAEETVETVQPDPATRTIWSRRTSRRASSSDDGAEEKAAQ